MFFNKNNIYKSRLIDKITSNFIVSCSYTIILFSSWYYWDFELNFQFFSIPFGIIVLAFLFFGNKIIFGLLLSQIIFYLFIKKYIVELDFHKYFIISLYQLVCVPITLFILQRLNVTIGAGENYKLNKINIYHVLLIACLSSILLEILIIFSFFFFDTQINLLVFSIGSFSGAIFLIISMKLLVNIPNLIKGLVKI